MRARLGVGSAGARSVQEEVCQEVQGDNDAADNEADAQAGWHGGV